MTFWWQTGALMPKYVTQEYLDHRLGDFEERLDHKFVTKDHFNGAMNGVGRRFDDLMSKMDGMMVILQRLDQERLFSVEWIRRIESDVTKVKKHLKLA